MAKEPVVTEADVPTREEVVKSGAETIKEVSNAGTKTPVATDPNPVVKEEGVQTGDPHLGEELARAQAEEMRGTDETKIVYTDPSTVDEPKGVASAVREITPAQADNGKVYQDERINPRDTNAPDAGLTPEGVRIAE